MVWVELSNLPMTSRLQHNAADEAITSVKLQQEQLPLPSNLLDVMVWIAVAKHYCASS